MHSSEAWHPIRRSSWSRARRPPLTVAKLCRVCADTVWPSARRKASRQPCTSAVAKSPNSLPGRSAMNRPSLSGGLAASAASGPWTPWCQNGRPPLWPAAGGRARRGNAGQRLSRPRRRGVRPRAGPASVKKAHAVRGIEVERHNKLCCPEVRRQAASAFVATTFCCICSKRLFSRVGGTGARADCYLPTVTLAR